MPTEERFRQVKPGDADQCQTVGADGEQCKFAKIAGTQSCFQHGGHHQEKRNTAERVSMLRLGHWQNRFSDLKDHSSLKSLNEEIGILRMLLEERINKCLTPVDLSLATPAISELVLKVNTVVVNAVKLDMQLNNTINKTQVEQFSNTIITICSDLLTPEQLEILTTKLSEAMSTLGSPI